MAYATILVRFLSPGRLIKKVGRDVTDGDFVYIYSAIFKYQTDLFYCAQDIGAVVCPFIYAIEMSDILTQANAALVETLLKALRLLVDYLGVCAVYS